MRGARWPARSLPASKTRCTRGLSHFPRPRLHSVFPRPIKLQLIRGRREIKLRLGTLSELQRDVNELRWS
jgi:hypothetical protein